MFISILADLGAGLLSVLVGFFLFEITAALIPRGQHASEKINALRASVAVVVPAHNEGRNLISTILDLKAQLDSADRLIVVADNCSDDTAVVAAEFGAEVLERSDSSRTGKGYALDWAIQYLRGNPPDVVVFVDADCRIADNAIDELLTACKLSMRPTQARYLMTAPSDTEIGYQVAEFAWLTKNWVRPLGLLSLGLPCQLMGTGMAFPWMVINAAELASGEIVEDLKLGLELALAGYAPQFCPSARVSSVFPSSAEGNRNQRQRWEKGHLITIVSLVPKLLFRSVLRRDLKLLALTLDLMIPPLSLLGLLLIAYLFLAGLLAFSGGSTVPLFLSVANVASFAFAVFLSWIKFGKDILPIQALSAVAFYVLGKMPLYGRIFSGKSTSKWVRTDRASSVRRDRHKE